VIAAGRRRILVVDDEPGMLHALRRLLERGHDLLCCSSAEEALAAVPAFAPELALLDVRLPGADGFELMRGLRRLVPDLDVILMTGSLGDVDGKLIRALREEAFFFLQKPFDRELLLTLIARWQEQRRLASENAAYVARLEEDLRQARAFQQRMLPGEAATIAGLSLAGRYVPCETLGGDFYDWADAGGGRAAMVIADVAGHGVAAAMLTGFVNAAFHAAHAEDYAPAAVAARVRDGLRGLDEGSFVTLLCARIDAGRGVLELVSCGHGFAALLRGDEAFPLDPTGPLLSPAFLDVDCVAAVHRWRPGDAFLAWTDGIEEAVSESGALFGRERLFAALDRSGGLAGLLAGIERSVRAFVGRRPLRDDYTLLAAAGA